MLISVRPRGIDFHPKLVGSTPSEGKRGGKGKRRGRTTLPAPVANSDSWLRHYPLPFLLPLSAPTVLPSQITPFHKSNWRVWESVL